MKDSHCSVLENEAAPLLITRKETPAEGTVERNNELAKDPFCGRRAAIVTLLVTVVSLLVLLHYRYSYDNLQQGDATAIPIENAIQHGLEVDDGIFLWFRTWGNNVSGVPLLFVHGGPGGAVADYQNGNRRFFDANKLFVVEVDQRGTGQSQPSVRDKLGNAALYENISIAMINSDYEKVREHLGVEKWVVWGGSYGSTIGIDYAMRYPERTSALILRGIYLDTVHEMDEVYSQNAFVNDPKKLADFLQLYSYAAKNAGNQGRDLNPNDAYSLTKEYENMIANGDVMAIWQWYVFENNLMEEDPRKFLDPNVIDHSRLPEAQSTAFFETRLWIHETWEDPSNFLNRVDSLIDVPVWICQGLRDKVCPPQNAQNFVEALGNTTRTAPVYGHFIESGHEDTDLVMEGCLVQSMKECLKQGRAKNC